MEPNPPKPGQVQSNLPQHRLFLNTSPEDLKSPQKDLKIKIDPSQDPGSSQRPVPKPKQNPPDPCMPVLQIPRNFIVLIMLTSFIVYGT